MFHIFRENQNKYIISLRTQKVGYVILNYLVTNYTLQTEDSGRNCRGCVNTVIHFRFSLQK